jgi:hypothetical protein
MLYVASVSLAGAARVPRQKWPSRAQWSPRARTKPSRRGSRHGAQSCIHEHCSRHGARSCIYARLLSLSLYSSWMWPVSSDIMVPARAGSQAGAAVGTEHKAVSMSVAAGVEHEAASMLVYSLSLSLLILAGCRRSVAASCSSSRMQAARVCGQTWPVAGAPNGSRHDDSPQHAQSNQSPAAARGKEHARALRRKASSVGTWRPDTLLVPDVRAPDVP